MSQYQGKVRQGRKAMDGVSMQLMLELRNQPARLLGVSGDIGVPVSAFIDILDADIRRQRVGRLSAEWSTETGSQLLARLVTNREAFRKPGADPVLWLLRVRWHIHAAAYSYVTVQSGGHAVDADKVYQRPTSSSLSYRAMASWACRCVPIQFELGEVCFEILGEKQERGRQYRFPTKTTAAWLAWFTRLLGIKVPIPAPELGNGAYHGLRWTEMGCTRSMAETFLYGSAEAGYAYPLAFNLARRRDEARAYARRMGISYSAARKALQAERRTLQALGPQPTPQGSS